MIKWDEIQEFYNSGFSATETIIKFSISSRKFYNGVRNGLIKMRSKSESQIISHQKSPRKHTEETKKKISEVRKKYLSENPDMVPYKLNHSSKESYPETYFTDIFRSEKIDVEESTRIGLYELDFSIPDRKIDIEIDGEQHYCDTKIVESDIRRTKYLEDNGWDVIRIRWSDYKRLKLNDRIKFIIELKDYINNIVNIKPKVSFVKSVRGKNLCSCGCYKIVRSTKCNKCSVDNKLKKRKTNSICKYCLGKCSYNNNRCEECYRIHSRKVDRPNIEFLLIEIEEIGYCAVGRKYGVSDNTIRKWIKKI